MECLGESKSGAELIIAYGAGTLAPEVRFALEQHLEACEKCRAIAEAQRAVWSALDSWVPEPVSPNFNEALYRRIGADQHYPWWRRLFQARWSWRPAMPVAAACAALIAVFLLKGPAEQQPSSQPAPAPQIEQVERALDDMDMLKQLGVAAPRETPSSPEQI